MSFFTRNLLSLFAEVSSDERHVPRDYHDFTTDEIEALLFPKMPIRKSEIAVVFSRGPMIGMGALRAAELYTAGMIDHIILTGGDPVHGAKDSAGFTELGVIEKAGLPQPKIIDGKEQCEAEWAYDILQSLNIPDTAISYENTSHNTGENVTHAIDQCGFGAAQSAILIGEFSHC